MAARLSDPVGLAIDHAGNIYIADADDDGSLSGGRVRRVNAAGIITTFAGGMSPITGDGDGGPATDASLSSLSDVAVDVAGNVYILDGGKLRKIDA